MWNNVFSTKHLTVLNLLKSRPKISCQPTLLIAHHFHSHKPQQANFPSPYANPFCATSVFFFPSFFLPLFELTTPNTIEILLIQLSSHYPQFKMSTH